MNEHEMYLMSPEATTCLVTVVAVDISDADAPRIRTSDTIFHPRGGGQPHDTGSVSWGSETAAVIDVCHDAAGGIWHTLRHTSSPSVGQRVTLSIDSTRRARLTRTHSAAHIICGVVAREYGAAVTGCDMDELTGRLDFDGLPGGIADQLEAMVNDAIATNAPVRYYWLPRELAADDTALVHSHTDRVPMHVKEVRVVEIEGIDREADGGTHVKNTAEVGKVRIRKLENKGSGNRRVRFEVLDA